MNERHEIILTAKDGVTSVLTKVGNTAQQTGAKVDAANKKAARSTQNWSTEAKVLGGIMGGALVGGMALSVRSASNLQESISKSTVVFGDNASEIRSWAGDAATSMGLSERSALEAAGTFGNLFSTMGLGQDAAADLSMDIVGLASDLASFNNIGTDDALEKLRAGLVGEVEPLRALGVNLNEAAVTAELLKQGVQQVNGTFSDAQKIQARYALIMAQTGNAQGDFARTSDGMANQMRIAQAEFDNAAATLGTALLPVATEGVHILATLANGFGQLPEPLQTATAALGVFSAGLLVIGPPAAKAVDAVRALSESARLASVGSAALNLAVGPVGLLGAVGGLTAGLVYLVATTDEFTSSAQAAERESANLANSYAALAASITDLAERERTRQTFAEFSGIQEQAQRDLRAYEELQNALVEWQSEFPQLESVAVGALVSINEETQEWLDFNHDGRIAMNELTAATEQFGQKALLTSDQAKSIGDNLTETLSHADIDITAVLEDFNDLENQWRAGTITGQQFDAAVEDMARTWGTYTPFVLEAEQATVKVTDAIRFASHEWHAAVPVLADLTDEVNDNTDAMGQWYVETHAAVPIIGDVFEATVNLGDAFATTSGHAKSGADIVAAFKDEAVDLSAEIDKLGSTLLPNLEDRAGTAYSRIVGFTGGMVSAIQTTKDWSDETTGLLGSLYREDGTLSDLGRLLNQGTLDAEDHTEAIAAQTQIYDDLARAQDASAVIQIKQIDTLADGTKATADYLERLAELPEAEQAVALAWADTDLAGRADEIATLASSFGDMDAVQQQTFTNMVKYAAAADPQLALILEDAGLIKESLSDPTGWALVIDSESARESLDITSQAVGSLIEVLAAAYHLDVDAILHDSDFWARYNALPSEKVIGVRFRVGPSPELALGGMVPWEGDTAATGRMARGMTLVGEHGPELAMLPGGTTVIPNHASQYMGGKGGGGVTFNGPITIVANDPQAFMRQMRTYESRMVRS